MKMKYMYIKKKQEKTVVDLVSFYNSVYIYHHNKHNLLYMY